MTRLYVSLVQRDPYDGRIERARPASLSDLADTHGLVECETCGGKGYEVVEHIRTVAEHHPNCDGYTCDSSCPIPVPVPEYEREPCPSCVSGWTVDLEVVEVVMKAQADEGSVLYERFVTDPHVAKAGLLAYLTHLEERL